MESFSYGQGQSTFSPASFLTKICPFGCFLHSIWKFWLIPLPLICLSIYSAQWKTLLAPICPSRCKLIAFHNSCFTLKCLKLKCLKMSAVPQWGKSLNVYKILVTIQDLKPGWNLNRIHTFSYKSLYNYWIDCHEVRYRSECSSRDELWYLWSSKKFNLAMFGLWPNIC